MEIVGRTFLPWPHRRCGLMPPPLFLPFTILVQFSVSSYFNLDPVDRIRQVEVIVEVFYRSMRLLAINLSSSWLLSVCVFRLFAAQIVTWTVHEMVLQRVLCYPKIQELDVNLQVLRVVVSEEKASAVMQRKGGLKAWECVCHTHHWTDPSS